ncbi:MAG: hypothetical protein HC880_21050 [Bacteroidia bacterium]|nr:hypothetical protein [Bacteroidia bacterium]
MTVNVGGEPWHLPSRFFIDPEQTWWAVEEFLKSGQRTPKITWGRLEEQNWDYGLS